MIMEQEKTFTYRDSKNVEHTVSFASGDFSLSQVNADIHDVKMKSKPTTFFKDALRRFVKNKSSVAGGVILGAILLLTIFVPIFDQNSIDTTNTYLSYQTKLAPKLFDTGTGFWDGTTQVNDVAIDFDWESYYANGTYDGAPVTTQNSSYEKEAIVGDIVFSKVGEKKISDNAVSYARGGYVRLSLASGSSEPVSLTGSEGLLYLSSYDYTLNVQTVDLPEDFTYGKQGTYSLYLMYRQGGSSDEFKALTLASDLTGGTTVNWDLSKDQTLLDAMGSGNSVEAYFQTTLNSLPEAQSSVLIKSVTFSAEDASFKVSDAEKEKLAGISCTDAALKMYETVEGKATKYNIDSKSGEMKVYKADYVTGSFRYDTYYAVYSDQYSNGITAGQLKNYENNGWLKIDYPVDEFLNDNPRDTSNQQRFIAGVSLTEEGESHCPLRIDEEHPLSLKVVKAGSIVTVTFSGTISRYRLYGYTSSPRFIFGTDDQGRDMWKLVFNGLRYSVLLGVITTIINLAFGLVWGAISGYFGGWVDLVMERVCDILGGIPWVVVMTLILINKPDNMSTIVMLGIALCATGWLGTSSLTRTQFYRYKDREYILAARTLGASDGRLIFRHILPNAIGTLITSSVLMIPSVIFSEASLTYLGLINGMQGFGITLTNNQQYMTTYPYLIVFPSVVMALIMISFNLFGNGLRDAFNPSLKGGE